MQFMQQQQLILNMQGHSNRQYEKKEEYKYSKIECKCQKPEIQQLVERYEANIVPTHETKLKRIKIPASMN